MAASKQDIIEWFDSGVQKGATHMIIVCDTYNYEDYPVYVMSDEDARSDVRKMVEEYGKKSMQRVMEVYKLELGKDAQFLGDEYPHKKFNNRVFNY